jgi:hypothetical protein
MTFSVTNGDGRVVDSPDSSVVFDVDGGVVSPRAKQINNIRRGCGNDYYDKIITC